MQQQPASYAPITSSPTQDNKRAYMFIACLGILLTVGAFSQYTTGVRTESTSKETFSQALEQALKVSYVNRTIGSHGQLTQATTDLTNPKNPTSILRTASDQGTVERFLIKTPPYPMYLRLHAVPEWGKVDTKAAEGKWLSVSTMNEVFDAGGSDLGWAQHSINSPLGDVIMGNFTSEQREKILAAYTTKQVYTISDVTAERLHGKSVWRYQLLTNRPALQQTHNVAADALGTERVGIGSEQVIYEFWVDREKKQIVRTTAKYGAGYGTTVIDYTYPSKLHLTPPAAKPVGPFITR